MIQIFNQSNRRQLKTTIEISKSAQPGDNPQTLNDLTPFRGRFLFQVQRLIELSQFFAEIIITSLAAFSLSKGTNEVFGVKRDDIRRH